MIKIVNLKTYKNFDYIYCGRGSIYGNPFTHIKHKTTLAEHIVPTRSDSIIEYKKYFYERIKKDEQFKKEILNLKGKTCGCYCVPLACHLEIIKEYLESYNQISDEKH